VTPRVSFNAYPRPTTFAAKEVVFLQAFPRHNEASGSAVASLPRSPEHHHKW
jgi:hypothetical protein